MAHSEPLVCVGVGVLLLAPYDLNIASRLEIEEALLVSMVVLLFVLLLTFEARIDDFAVGIVLACIYLTKSSMLLVCLVGLLWALVSYWKTKRRIAAFSAIFLIASILGWGAYVERVSGVFAVGMNASSWNGWNLYKGNNQWATRLYPATNLDTLDHRTDTNDLLPFVPVHNEWELQREQLKLGKAFISSHPSEVLQMGMKKIMVACCRIGGNPGGIPRT